MLKKFLVMFGMVAAFVGSAGAAQPGGNGGQTTNPNAGASCGELNKDDDYYLINNAYDLDVFACIVNSSASAFNGKAKLTADIHYLGNTKLLNANGDGLACGSGCGSEKSWIPLKNFAGTFDGQDHTIYGLFAVGNNGVGFIQNTSGSNATIKNLFIADSYFNATSTTGCSGNGNGKKKCPMVAGGFVAYTDDNSTLNLERCGFSGAISGGHDQNGGLIGAIGRTAILNLTNSYNEGYVNGSGLIGTAVQAGTVKVTNCYNTGTYAQTAYPLMGNPAVTGGVPTISGSNLGCNDAVEKCNHNFNSTGGTVTYVSSDPASIVANYWANIYGKVPENPDAGEGGGDSGEGDEPVNQLEAAKQLLQAQINSLKEEGMKGIDFDFKEIETCHLEGTSNVCNTSVVLVAVLKLELTDTVSTLNMPRNFPVYGVEYNRQFSKSSPECATAGPDTDPTTLPFSTTVLPFTMDVKNIVGAKFFTPVELAPNEDNVYWHIGVVEVTGNVEAHTPYLVCPTESKLTFNGSTTVMKTDGDGVAKSTSFDRNPADPAGPWNFVGLYTKRTFGSGSSDDGRVYAFSGGKFVHIVTGNSPILRAYILAPEGSDPGTAKPNPMPGMMRAVSASGVQSEESSRPTQMLLKILGTDADTISWIPVDFSPVDPEELDSTEGEITRIRQPLIFPMQRNHNGPWFDLKGRNMNRRPSTKGVFLNKGVPAVVK